MKIGVISGQFQIIRKDEDSFNQTKDVLQWMAEKAILLKTVEHSKLSR